MTNETECKKQGNERLGLTITYEKRKIDVNGSGENEELRKRKGMQQYFHLTNNSCGFLSSLYITKHLISYVCNEVTPKLRYI